jgi:hypothetical protein
MKKSILISGALLIALSTSAFAQKHKPHHHNHGHHVSNHNHGFFGGILAGILLNEVFGSATHSYRKMYFEYKPYKDTWRLRKDYTQPGSVFYDNEKVTAKFENPNGGRDFIVRLNNRGEWELDCPRKLAKLFKNKVRRNL